LRLRSIASGNASPIATSCTLLSAFSACDAAPVPRPPQPTRPMRISSEPAAWAARSMVRPPSSPLPTAAADEVLRKLRRETDSVAGDGNDGVMN